MGVSDESTGEGVGMMISVILFLQNVILFSNSGVSFHDDFNNLGINFQSI